MPSCMESNQRIKQRYVSLKKSFQSQYLGLFYIQLWGFANMYLRAILGHRVKYEKIPTD